MLLCLIAHSAIINIRLVRAFVDPSNLSRSATGQQRSTVLIVKMWRSVTRLAVQFSRYVEKRKRQSSGFLVVGVSTIGSHTLPPSTYYHNITCDT